MSKFQKQGEVHEQMSIQENTATLDDDAMWRTVVRRHSDGPASAFLYAVRSTGIYCRPGCPAKLPTRDNVQFFAAPEDAEAAGFRACLRCRPREAFASTAKVLHVCSYIKSHLEDQLTLGVLAEHVGLSTHHFQRSFRKATGLTPRQYVAALRTEKFKQGLSSGESVTAAMIDAGYGSSRALYEKSNAALGMTPTKFRRGGESIRIAFTTVQSELGAMLIASTDRGICEIALGDSSELLETELRGQYHAATIVRDDDGMKDAVTSLVEHLQGVLPNMNLPLDVRATAFQQLVWKQLQSIPYGQTATYAQIAEAIGKPSAVRAVANACAGNHVALAIPCHRIVRTDGRDGGLPLGRGKKKGFAQQRKNRDQKGNRLDCKRLQRVNDYRRRIS